MRLIPLDHTHVQGPRHPGQDWSEKVECDQKSAIGVTHTTKLEVDTDVDKYATGCQSLNDI